MAILGPFWPNFGSKNRSKIKVDFCTKKGMDAKSLWEPNFRVQGTNNFSGGALKITEHVHTRTYRCIKVHLTRPAVLRRIEHAARNTAAAPFCRRSSLEWPCKIWILLLSIVRLCCIFSVCWGFLVTILGALGVHFGSQNRFLVIYLLAFLWPWICFLICDGIRAQFQFRVGTIR